MATAPETATPPLTAEEFARRPDPGWPEELVRGKIVAGEYPGMLHGVVCANVGFLLGEYVEVHDVGRVSLGSGVVTTRNPDSVRGPDVLYYSCDRLTRETPDLDGYPDAPPNLVFEVVSQFDRWTSMLERTAEFLQAGVSVVCVLDPLHRTLQYYSVDQPPAS